MSTIEVPRRRSLRLGRHWLGMIGAAILAFMTAVAILAPLLAPHDPMKVDLRGRLAPPVWEDGGTAKHLLGTDNVGRDVLSRMIHGSRVSLSVGIAAVALGAVFGSLVGCLAGFFGRRVDALLSWVINVQLSFPFTLLAIFLLAAFGGGFLTVVAVVALGSWVNYARIVRGQVIAVQAQDYVEAARSIGVGTARLIRRHILPNTLSPIIVIASFSMAQAILTEAALTFLGVGLDPTVPSWGGMLTDGRDYLHTAWWIATMPGIAIAVTVLGVNLLGDWLRDVLDPKLRR